MANDTPFEGLVAKLQSALESTATSVPEAELVRPPSSGISLLDVKNELLLSYLQNLVFLILHKLRQRKQASDINDGLENGVDEDGPADLASEATKKLVELRVYLERGVRPLEGRLKYQIDKVIRAADTAAQRDERKSKKQISANRKKDDANGASDEEDSDASESSIDDLAYRPNPAAFVDAEARVQDDESTLAKSRDGIYRPPRITPTSLPTTVAPAARTSRKPQRSAAVDEYIDAEMSTAPVAEPSIGSTIISGGRTTKSVKERQTENERTAYEETNFVRLPAESKKDRAKKRRPERGFGGEELSLLGDDLGRIGRLTDKRKGPMKRRMTEDGPRGDGFGGEVRLAKKNKRRR
ncbi:MAG: hypothetical protein M1828_003073 [Chrysothrix sp. TS-e1954]|nr:MAG: hypothetical protein M1828_003073 [Chrysothrix sp. TS-e1954]